MKNSFSEYIESIRKKLPGYINLQNIIFFSVIAAFIVIVIWSDAISAFFTPVEPVRAGITLTPTTLFGTPTPLPAEWLVSAEQTDGILVGGIIILTTILVGTSAIIFRNRY